MTLCAPEPLSNNHQLDAFDCGKPTLNEWLCQMTGGGTIHSAVVFRILCHFFTIRKKEMTHDQTYIRHGCRCQGAALSKVRSGPDPAIPGGSPTRTKQRFVSAQAGPATVAQPYPPNPARSAGAFSLAELSGRSYLHNQSATRPFPGKHWPVSCPWSPWEPSGSLPTPQTRNRRPSNCFCLQETVHPEM